MSAEVEAYEEILGGFGDDFAEQIAEMVAKRVGPDLTPQTPEGAVTKYFEERNLPTDSENTHWSSLHNHFLKWCTEVEGIEEMNGLSGNDLAKYQKWRREEAPTRVDKLKPTSEETQQKITRVFIKRCEKWDFVRPGLHEYVILPDVKKEDRVRKDKLASDRAKDILEWLDSFEYTSEEHMVWLIMSATGARLGAIHSLDLGDYVRNEQGAYLKFRHRPKTGTTLKNGVDGERKADIKTSVADVIDDYIDKTRTDNTDEFGRTPLLTTSHGRLAKGTIRNYIYAWTRPCVIGEQCPYGKEPEECEGARRKNWAYKCPDSLSCHPVRKGYITAELEAGVPKAILSEQCDVSEDIMAKHYDLRTEDAKLDASRIAMRLAHEKKGGYGE